MKSMAADLLVVSICAGVRSGAAWLSTSLLMVTTFWLVPPGLASKDDLDGLRQHRAHLKTIVIAADSRVPEPMEFERVSDTLIVPLPAWRVVLAIEHAGHRLRVDGADIVIGRGTPIDPRLLAELKRWKPHAIRLLAYTADDSHLRTVVGSGTTGAAS